MKTNNAAHTPGPWIVNLDDTVYQAGKGGRRICDCELSPPHLRPAAPNETDKANARLIAAAPDLLAALESLLDHCGDEPFDIEVCNNARAAINKARSA